MDDQAGSYCSGVIREIAKKIKKKKKLQKMIFYFFSKFRIFKKN
jgi:predicted nucleic acid-binding Zn ribbon protein